MLYLAEVQKKAAGFMGGAKVEFKLLARQQSEQSWNAVPGEDLIPADSYTDYEKGQLVLVELTQNRQIQNVQEASKQLVAILQNFSRMREKFRTQEEEIESWKQSLVYQSQELTRRELEMEARQEEIDQFQSQLQELEQLRQTTEGERQALAAAQAQQQADLERLQALQTEVETNGGGRLQPEQLQQIDYLLGGLSQELTQGVSQEKLQQQQHLLYQNWQYLEQQRHTAQQQQDVLDQQLQELAVDWEAWRQGQHLLEQAQAELAAREANCKALDAAIARTQQQLQTQEGLQQQMSRALQGESANVEVAASLKPYLDMPLTDLQAAMTALEVEVKKFTSFINDQEEELTMQRQSVEALLAKMQQVSEYERMSLAADLDSEQQNCQLLNDTLEGQRQRLRERQEMLDAHKQALHRRQDPVYQAQLNLQPFLSEMAAQSQKLRQDMAQLTQEAEQSRNALGQQRETCQQLQASQSERQQQLQAQEADLQRHRLSLAELWGQVNYLPAILQPIQDNCSDLAQQLGAGMNGDGNGNGNGNGRSHHLLDELKGLFQGLAG